MRFGGIKRVGGVEGICKQNGDAAKWANAKMSRGAAEPPSAICCGMETCPACFSRGGSRGQSRGEKK